MNRLTATCTPPRVPIPTLRLVDTILSSTRWERPSEKLIESVAEALKSLEVPPQLEAFTADDRRRTMPVRLKSYSSSATAARQIFGYDDAQLSLAENLNRECFECEAEPMYRGDPEKANLVDSPFGYFLGTQPFRAMHVLLSDTRFGLTSADLRVVYFHETRDGRLQASGIPFLILAPAEARYFDHDDDDGGRTLAEVADFIDSRRASTFLVDASAAASDRLLRFDRCRSVHHIRDRLLEVCRAASNSFDVPSIKRGESVMVVSSRESTSTYVGKTLALPSISMLRKLHLSFDTTVDNRLPKDDSKGNPVSKAGIAAIGFADLGLSRMASRPKLLPGTRATVERTLSEAITPFVDALAIFRQHVEHADAFDVQGGMAGQALSTDAHRVTELDELEHLMRSVPGRLERAAQAGTVASLRDALRMICNLRRGFEGSAQATPALRSALSLAHDRLTRADQAICAVERMEKRDGDMHLRKLIMRCRRQEINVLGEAYVSLFTPPLGKLDAVSPATMLSNCVDALSACLFDETLEEEARPSQAELRVCEQHMTVLRTFEERCSGSSARRALASTQALMTRIAGMRAAQLKSIDAKSPGEQICKVLRETIRKVDRIALVADPTWSSLEDAALTEGVPDASPAESVVAARTDR